MGPIISCLWGLWIEYRHLISCLPLLPSLLIHNGLGLLSSNIVVSSSPSHIFSCYSTC